MSTHSMTTRSMTTRSMTKSETVQSASSQRKQKVSNSPKPTILHATTPKAESRGKISTEVLFVRDLKNVPKATKPLAEILTSDELEARGLNKTHSEGGWRKVIKASELDILVTASKDVRDKWAVAPDGWYWKAYSEKCYFWFDWFELEPIPEK